MFCEHCGKPMDEGSVFCGECGKKSAINVTVPETATSSDTSQMPWLTHTDTNATSKENIQFERERTSPHANEQYLGSGQPKTKKSNSQNIIIALLAIIIVGGAILWQMMNQNESNSSNTNVSTNTQKPEVEANTSPSPTPSETTPPSPTVLPKQINIDEINNIVSGKTSSANVSFAIADLNSEELYVSENADTPFVGAGFYLPVYFAYNSNGGANTSLTDKANAMMSTMDNQAANTLIESVGGIQGLNNLLQKNGYIKTVFNRKFGDVAASNRGQENYTSAKEAALILKQLYADGGYQKMNADLKKDGITLPEGVTIYAHRGFGIGTSFNVFAIVTTPTSKYAVAILTAKTGNTAETAKTSAIPIISEILANIQQQMRKINE